MKIIIDTNLFISGIFWKDLPNELLTAWASNKFELIVSKEILEEYSRVLEEIGKTKNTSLAEEWILFIAKNSILIDKTVDLQLCRDKFDDKFINCAVSGKADYIVSGDKDLLVLEEIKGVKILTAKQFMKIIKSFN